jgi:hypothetical protein
LKVYATFEPCFRCGTDERYVINGGCVACSIARGNARYAAQSPTEKQQKAARDAARYLARKAAE